MAELFRGSQSINLEMVRSGQGFAYRQYIRQCDGADYLGAESAAKQRGLGVWSVPGGIQRPWDWRHGSRSTSSVVPPGSVPSSPSPSGKHYTCKQIGSFARAQELLKQGHTYLDRNGDGVACESLR